MLLSFSVWLISLSVIHAALSIHADANGIVKLLFKGLHHLWPRFPQQSPKSSPWLASWLCYFILPTQPSVQVAVSPGSSFPSSLSSKLLGLCKRLFWTTVPCSFSCPVPTHPPTSDIISQHLLQDAFTNLPELVGESLLPSHSTLAFVVTQHTQLKSPVHETISGTKYGFQNLAGAQKCLWSEQMNEWGNEWMKGCVRKTFWMQKWKVRQSKR